jgi:hypothetical protein
MATKKKAVKKKAAKKKAVTANTAKNPAEIYIVNGNTFPTLAIKLDGKGKKHSSKVFWQGLDDPLQTYQITLDNAPAPFKKVTSPIQTDASGATQTLRVDTQYANGMYGYHVLKLIRDRFVVTSAGGIIIES